MGRNPKIRINLDSDVQYLLRLKHALEEDDGFPLEFRSEACGHIQTLVLFLMKAPPKRGAILPAVQQEDTPRKKRARG